MTSRRSLERDAVAARPARRPSQKRVGASPSLLSAAALSVAMLVAATGAASAQSEDPSPAIDGDGVLLRLFDDARTGEVDTHLPYVLHRLEKALSEQNLIAFLDLVDPAYFREQFGLIAAGETSPGRQMHQFSCEFFALCDISKAYAFNDVVSAKVVSVADAGPLILVRIEMRMWDGLFLPAEIFYDPATSRLSSGRA